MKKAYTKPAMETLEVDASELLSSSHSAHGHETACAHGAHAWFCDDNDDD